MTRAGRAADERGSAVAELTLVLPALMLAVALVVQLALWALAAHAVQASAASAGDVARSLGGTQADAVATARGELSAIGGALVTSPTVSVVGMSGNGLVTVAVAGTVPSLFPGLHLHVSATSVGPAGVFRASG
jgi:hypothetical protein